MGRVLTIRCRLQYLNLHYLIAGMHVRERESVSLDPLFSLQPMPVFPALEKIYFHAIRASPANAIKLLTVVAPNLEVFVSGHEGGRNTDLDDFGQNDTSDSMIIPPEALPRLRVFNVAGMSKTREEFVKVGRLEPAKLIEVWG